MKRGPSTPYQLEVNRRRQLERYIKNLERQLADRKKCPECQRVYVESLKIQIKDDGLQL